MSEFTRLYPSKDLKVIHLVNMLYWMGLFGIKSCRPVIRARTFMVEGDLGINIEWKCWLRTLASSFSPAIVFPSAFGGNISLSSYLE